MYKAFLDNIPCPVWIMGMDRKYKYVNSYFKRLHNLENTEILNKTIGEVISKELSEIFIKRVEEVFIYKKIMVYDVEINGNYNQCYSVPLFDDKNNICAVAGLGIDINERKTREIEILNQKNILQTVMDTIPNPIFYKDTNSKYLGANQICKNQLKIMIKDSIIGKDDSEIMFDKKLAKKFMEDDKKIMASRKIMYTKPNMTLPDGTVRAKECVKAPIIDNNNEVIGIVGLAHDITDRKEMEDRLRYLSYTDILTGLYNRTSFEDRVKNFKKQECLPLGIIMGDVNGLKLINDTFGHGEGDRLLVSIANVLKQCCGEFADIYRWGGDEFVITIPNADHNKCKNMIEDIKFNCKEHAGKLIELSISLGEAIQSCLLYTSPSPRDS